MPEKNRLPHDAPRTLSEKVLVASTLGCIAGVALLLLGCVVGIAFDEVIAHADVKEARLGKVLEMSLQADVNSAGGAYLFQNASVNLKTESGELSPLEVDRVEKLSIEDAEISAVSVEGVPVGDLMSHPMIVIHHQMPDNPALAGEVVSIVYRGALEYYPIVNDRVETHFNGTVDYVVKNKDFEREVQFLLFDSDETTFHGLIAKWGAGAPVVFGLLLLVVSCVFWIISAIMSPEREEAPEQDGTPDAASDAGKEQ